MSLFFSFSTIGIAIPSYRVSWPSPSFGLLGRSFQIDGVSGAKLLCYFMVFLSQVMLIGLLVLIDRCYSGDNDLMV